MDAQPQAEGETLQLPLLLRCIEQGGNLFTDVEKGLIMQQGGGS